MVSVMVPTVKPVLKSIVENTGASGIHFLQNPYISANFQDSFIASSPKTRAMFATTAADAISMSARTKKAGASRLNVTVLIFERISYCC